MLPQNPLFAPLAAVGGERGKEGETCEGLPLVAFQTLALARQAGRGPHGTQTVELQGYKSRLLFATILFSTLLVLNYLDLIWRMQSYCCTERTRGSTDEGPSLSRLKHAGIVDCDKAIR